MWCIDTVLSSAVFIVVSSLWVRARSYAAAVDRIIPAEQQLAVL